MTRGASGIEVFLPIAVKQQEKKLGSEAREILESRAGNLKHAWRHILAKDFSSAIRSNTEISVLLVALFLLRTFMSSRNSYWLDELYSIFRFGIENSTLTEALTRLSEHSIHPPLYQGILYMWMSIWGDSEFATRSLSNLFVTLASLALYLLLRLMWQKTPSFIGSALFGFSFPAMHYGLEARSYGLTMLLVTVSSLVFLKAIVGLTRGDTKRVSANLFLGSLANAGLLLTHYYNLFWVGAQVLFFVGFSIVAVIKGKKPRALTLVFWSGILPFTLFLALWGRVLFSQFMNRRSEWPIGTAGYHSIIDSFFFMIVEPNLSGLNIRWPHNIPETSWGGPLSIVFLAAFVLVVLFLVFFAERSSAQFSPNERLVSVYLVFWLVAPLFLTSLGFSLIGAERLHIRYFLHSTVAFFPVLLVTLVAIGRPLLYKGLERGLFKKFVSGALFSAIFLVSIAGGYLGATRPKDDWRGITRQIVESSSQLEPRIFRVVSVVNKKIPDAEEIESYYFSKMSPSVNLNFGYLRSEAIGEDYSELQGFIERGDKSELIYFMFTHNKAHAFPGMMEYLDAELDLVFSNLSANGTGFVVFEHK